MSARQPRGRRRASSRRGVIVGVAAGIIFLVLVALVVARSFVAAPQPASTGTDVLVPATITHALAAVSPAVENQVGRGTATLLPSPARAQLLRGPTGLPEVLYVGAEWCPFCAAERWALIIALDRFGQFAGLRTGQSASDDVDPNTPTFSYYGSTYTSAVVAFTPVELASSTKVGGQYQPLQTPTPDQTQLVKRFDAPPFVPAASAGAIPFVDVANQFVQAGAAFSPQLLDGLTRDQIAGSLSNPHSDLTRAIVGSANVTTAAICLATQNHPADACGQPAIMAIETTLAQSPVGGGSG